MTLTTDNMVTLAVGIMLIITAMSLRKRTGLYDWLYIVLGIVIICIGIFRISGIVRI